ncbi:hypothetical protein B1222_23530 (plasmid) [Paenibacillus larvae subsp. pulvifaciens]|nr:hypothetical protein B1222_23530 [Paenibacillus larvae subsp. pulvifaciens]AQZ49278.1 hypothetical protein B5S25_22490 [Paenibacillus larvae subsp. pulvifaciens]
MFLSTAAAVIMDWFPSLDWVHRYERAASEENLDWKMIYAIDCVRYDSELDGTKPRDTVKLFIYYVDEKVTTVDKNGKEKTMTQVVKKYRTLDEVMDMLKFTDEQKSRTREILEYVERGDDSGTDTSQVPGQGESAPPQDGNLENISGDRWPLKGYKARSSSYGPRKDPFTGKTKFHKGIDIPAPNGTPISSAMNGIVKNVKSTNNSGGYGELTIIESDDGSIQTYYAHQSRIVVRQGMRVKVGDLIGYVGSTGQSTGPHLHFEIRINGKVVNPLENMHALP